MDNFGGLTSNAIKVIMVRIVIVSVVTTVALGALGVVFNCQLLGGLDMVLGSKYSYDCSKDTLAKNFVLKPTTAGVLTLNKDGTVTTSSYPGSNIPSNTGIPSSTGSPLLSLVGNVLSISGGNSVSLPEGTNRIINIAVPGPAGAVGQRGDVGPQGAAGTPGSRGDAGVNGTNGANGVGISSIPTAGGVGYGDGALLQFTPMGVGGQFLQSAGAAVPVWVTGTLPLAGTVANNTIRWNGTNWVESGALTNDTTNIAVTGAGNFTVGTGVTTLGGTLGVTSNTTLSGNLNANGNTVIGNAAADTLTVTSIIQGASPLVFEGATTNAFQTTLAVTDPTATRTITLPDATGMIALTNTSWQIGGNAPGAGSILGTTDNSNITFQAGTGTITVTSALTQTGANTFSTGTGNVSLNGNTTITGANTLTVGTGATTLGGALQMTTYGTGVNAGVPTFGLAVDATGNVIEVTYPEIANGTAVNNTLRWNGTNWVESTALTNDNTDVTTTGDIYLNGGDLNTTAATATLFNTNATTVSLAGVATTLNLGIGNTAATINLGTGTGGNTLNVGTGAAVNTLNFGNTTTTTAINLNGGSTAGTGGTFVTGDFSLLHGTDYNTNGSQNNVNFGSGSLIRIITPAIAGPYTITGIAGGTNGKILTLFNTSNETVTLTDNDGSSLFGNWINTGTSTPYTIYPGGAVMLQYDAVGIWRIMSTDPGGSSTRLSSISPANNTNSIDNTNFAQNWNWSTATAQNPLTLTAGSLTTGSLLSLSSLAGSNALNITSGNLLLAGGFSQTGANTFSTGTGAVTLNGATTIASGQNLTSAGGAANFDFSASSGTFATSTGANTFNGNTTISGANTFTTGTGLTTISGNLTQSGAATLTTGTGLFTASGPAIIAGNLNANGNTIIGNAAADTLTVTSTIQGASPLVFEGATTNAFQTTFAITDPTAARTITFPDASGTLLLDTSACPSALSSFFCNGGNTAGAAMSLGTNNAFALNFRTGGTNILTLNAAGTVLSPVTDNNVDLGINTAGGGPFRFKNGYFGTSVGVGATTTMTDGAITQSTAGTGNLSLVTSGGTTGQLILTSGAAAGQGTTQAYSLFATNNLGAADELFQLGDAGSTMMTVLGNGNVGIGTTTPGQLLDISSTSNTYARINRNAISNDAILMFSTASANNWFIGQGGGSIGAGSDFNFYDYNGNTSRMTLKSGGNVGIGTTSPASPLDLTFTGTTLSANNSLTLSNLSAVGQTNQMFKFNGTNMSKIRADFVGNIYMYGTNTVGFGVYNPITEAGQSDLVINSSHFVGIGTTNPIEPLDIVGQSGTGNATDLGFRLQDGVAGTPHDLKFGINTVGNGYGYIQSTFEGTAHTPLALDPLGGNVGIGITTPTAKLHVSASGMAQNQNYVVFNDGNADRFQFRADAGAGSTLFINSGTSIINSSGVLALNSGGGNVGIGTTTPLQKFQVGNSDGSYALLTSSNGTAYQGGLLLSNSPSNFMWKWSPSFNATQAGSTLKLSLVAGGATETDLINPPLYITGSGMVGIANSTPTANLTVAGTNAGIIEIGSGAYGGNYAAISVNGSGNSATGYNIMSSPTDQSLYINSPGGSQIYLRQGNGLIANYSTGFALCYDAPSSGSLAYSGGTDCTVSSRRFKHDIIDIAGDSGLNEVMKLRPVSFKYNLDRDPSQQSQVGFIAEEMQNIDPRLVSFGSNGEIQSVRYANITAVLTKAVQELAGQVNDLKANSVGANISGNAPITSNGADYAEYFYQQTNGDAVPGDVVCSTSVAIQIKKCSNASDKVIGVVSTQPSVVGNGSIFSNANPGNTAKIGLVGIVPTKVSNESGNIAVGDYLTFSATNVGYAKKAVTAGPTFGRAVEDFSGTTGTIKVFITAGWVDPTVMASYGSNFGQFFLNANTLTPTNPNYNIATSGNIGIGVAGDPGSKFGIYGPTVTDADQTFQANFSNNVTPYNANPATGIAFGNIYNSSGNVAGMGGIEVGKENPIDGNLASYLAFNTRSATTGITEGIRIDSNGHLGVGITDPFQMLDVKIQSGTGQAGDLGMRLQDGTPGTPKDLKFGVNTTGNGYGYIQSTHEGVVHTDIILSPLGGNVGIGTTTTIAPLTVAGGVVVDALDTNNSAFTASNVLRFGTGGEGISSKRTLGGANQWGLDFYTASNNRMSIVNNGNVGIGNTNPGANLDVAGTIRQSSALNCNLSTNASGDLICTSDVTLKNVKGVYTGGLAEIERIDPIFFNYLGEDYTHVGFSAQNVQSVLPQATPIQGNGKLGLDSNALLALSINAIKQLNDRIVALNLPVSSNGNMTTGVSSSSTVDVVTRVDKVESKLSEIDAKVLAVKDTVSTSSANLAELNVRLHTTEASQSALLSELDLIKANLKQLTDASVAIASGSAVLSGTSTSSNANLAQDLKVSNLKVVGNSVLGSTMIVGDLVQNGTLTITDGSTLNAIGTLKLQTSPLAEKLDIFNGKVLVDKNGNITAKAITVDQISTDTLVVGKQNLGQSKIATGEDSVTVKTNAVTDKSVVFTQPLQFLDSNIIISDKKAGQGFTAQTKNKVNQDLYFYWWIVEQK